MATAARHTLGDGALRRSAATAALSAYADGSSASMEPRGAPPKRAPKATTERSRSRRQHFAPSTSKDSQTQLRCGRGWPQTHMSRYYFFENSHWTHFGALYYTTAAAWPDRQHRCRQRHLKPLAMAVLAPLAPCTALTPTHSPGSCRSAAVPALHRPR